MTDSSDDDESSSSEDESSDSDESSVSNEGGVEKFTNTSKESIGSLIDIDYNKPVHPINRNELRTNGDLKSSQLTSNSNTSLATGGLEGLVVMAPLKFNKEEQTTPNGNIEEDSSNWTVLVRRDLSGDLCVTARFLRDLSREQELLLLGLDPNNTATVCVQIKFENRYVKIVIID